MPVRSIGSVDAPVPAARAQADAGVSSGGRIRGRPVPAAFPPDGPVYALLAGAAPGLRAEPGVRYVAVPHPSAQGLLSAAPDRGRGAHLRDLAAGWRHRLAQVLEVARP
ncbi:hypothetical protein tb265_50160 [Gemmatimonadetes bacterium T265]|nr:hypothetical protein tb265_50160 [Gemmatimonadetes bacterium T265]